MQIFIYVPIKLYDSFSSHFTHARYVEITSSSQQRLFFLIPRIRDSNILKKECGDISFYPTYHS